MQIKTTMRYHFSLLRMASHKMTKNNKCWREGIKRGTPLPTRSISTASVDTSMDTPQKSKNRATVWSSYPTTGYIPKGNEVICWRDTSMSMFIAALFTSAKWWTQPTHLSIDEWIKKMWSVLPWNIILPQKGMKFCHLKEHEWTWKTVC
jgi:hypothetical protein